MLQRLCIGDNRRCQTTSRCAYDETSSWAPLSRCRLLHDTKLVCIQWHWNTGFEETVRPLVPRIFEVSRGHGWKTDATSWPQTSSRKRPVKKHGPISRRYLIQPLLRNRSSGSRQPHIENPFITNFSAERSSSSQIQQPDH